LMFVVTGRVDGQKPPNPVATTNVLCPSKCQVVGTEHTEWTAPMQLNVVIVEGSIGTPGSFWGDYVADSTLSALKSNLSNILTHPSGPPPPFPGARPSAPIKDTVPYNEFYGYMNFYVSVEDPSADPLSAKGFFYCANIDARIVVHTGPPR